MNIQHAYDKWSEQYDTNVNLTRDVEAKALRESLPARAYRRCLEIGCGTGKNTVWLAERAGRITAVDLSAEMLAKAKEKIASETVRFVQTDIKEEWNFDDGSYDLITFSLVLEHIEDIRAILQKASALLAPDGILYIGELHPFRQYGGTKARFDTSEGRHEVECFTHHASDFVQAAMAQGLRILDVGEYFDNDDRSGVPRILMLLFEKTAK